MCYQIVERYAVCNCIYYQHSVDACSSYGQRGHAVITKTVLVGYACPAHSGRGAMGAYPDRKLSDSGYSSGHAPKSPRLNHATP
ncbi:hypothetical protein EJ06DRAFT_555458 [Trichodelitschia bisporula]|uniref:Uncharacterized protein n=1 Tax=Trichodelitschia bisporula TaxID=703511 RepID=A0A6G1I0L7_9PEZI|nr:hypothetical protein EJ06DRAFT_555458 [Trichodelitschia bisporula]